MSAWPAHALERATKSQVVPLRRGWILRHKGCRIDAATRADAVDGIVRGLAEGSRLTVVVLHHWQLWDGDGPHPAIRELARVLTRERCVGVAGALRELDG
jgi:hypothetical protein